MLPVRPGMMKNVHLHDCSIAATLKLKPHQRCFTKQLSAMGLWHCSPQPCICDGPQLNASIAFSCALHSLIRSCAALQCLLSCKQDSWRCIRKLALKFCCEPTLCWCTVPHVERVTSPGGRHAHQGPHAPPWAAPWSADHGRAPLPGHELSWDAHAG